MTTIEWIEELVPFIEYHSSEANKVQRLLAIREALAALEVVEWLRKNMTWSLNYFGDGGVCLENVVTKTRIDAPSLPELAEKLRGEA